MRALSERGGVSDSGGATDHVGVAAVVAIATAGTAGIVKVARMTTGMMSLT
ncbi:hypothetical protein OAG62_00905 [bacterium]|nr:hypothetical protein [bacterium]